MVAVHVGTSRVRVAALDGGGGLTDVAVRPLASTRPRPGWVEQDPEAVASAVAEAMAELAGRVGGPVAAVGLATPRGAVLAWDALDGRPRGPLVAGTDRRSAPRCRQLVDAGHGPRLEALTGLVVDPTAAGPRLGWLLAEGGVVADRGLALGTLDTWLLGRLGAGARTTDAGQAATTLLADLDAGAWSPELGELLGVPVAALAEIGPTRGRRATLDTPWGRAPVSALAGDGRATLWCVAGAEPGVVSLTLGATGAVLAGTGATRPPAGRGLLATLAWDLGPGGGAEGPRGRGYALEGPGLAAGAALDWLVDLGLATSPAEVLELAAATPGTDGAVVVPPAAGLTGPWWDPGARGAMVGLGPGVGRARLARATIEAVAHQVRDVLDAAAAASPVPLGEVRVSGALAASQLVLDLVADQAGRSLYRAATPEPAAAGIGWLAGWAEGLWDGDAPGRWWRADREAHPGERRSGPEARHARWRRGLERSRGWGRP